MDRLMIHGMELWVRCGCTAEERAFPQRVDLDLTLEIPLAEAGRADDLSKTVDYAAVAEKIRKELESREFRLLESLAERAAALALGFAGPSAVEVQARKRVLPGIQWAAVEIRRAR